MMPIEPGEDVDESEVMNVTGKDGIVRRYRRREMGVDRMINGKLSNNFYQGAVRTVEILKMIGFIVGLLWAGLWGVTEWVIVPQIERKIESTAQRVSAPIVERLNKIEVSYNGHLIETANTYRTYATRNEVMEEIERLRRDLARNR